MTKTICHSLKGKYKDRSRYIYFYVYTHWRNNVHYDNLSPRRSNIISKFIIIMKIVKTREFTFSYGFHRHSIFFFVIVKSFFFQETVKSIKWQIILTHWAIQGWEGLGGWRCLKFYIITYIRPPTTEAARSKESKSSPPGVLTPAADIE